MVRTPVEVTLGDVEEHLVRVFDGDFTSLRVLNGCVYRVLYPLTSTLRATNKQFGHAYLGQFTLDIVLWTVDIWTFEHWILDTIDKLGDVTVRPLLLISGN